MRNRYSLLQTLGHALKKAAHIHPVGQPMSGIFEIVVEETDDDKYQMTALKAKKE